MHDEMEDAMNTRASTASPLDVIALGWGLSAALVVLFVICLAVALVFPEWRGSHAWVGLFSLAPMTSPCRALHALHSRAVGRLRFLRQPRRRPLPDRRSRRRARPRQGS